MTPSGPRLVEVIATEYDFSPEVLYATPGQTLIVRVRNEGTMQHAIAFELPDGELRLDGNVSPQEAAELRFEAPATPGEYVMFCPITNHRALGMVGRLIVEAPTRVGLEEVGGGFAAPVMIAEPPDDSGRRFVVDQTGEIWIITADGTRLEEPFLDLSDRIVPLDPNYDERGLLGLAFHPSFADNGRFFVYYSAPLRESAPDDFDHTSHLEELRASGGADTADPASETIVLAVDQPQSNHNGGTVAFGPDGMLYLSLGDGGGANDTGPGHDAEIGNGQDRTGLLGSILRLDVDGAAPYEVPADNPFTQAEGAPEIWAYGFRNPYRFSFDRGGDGALLVGDAGQELWEEVSLVKRGGNYGWNRHEGTHCFDPTRPEDAPATCAEIGPYGEPLVWPVIEAANITQEGGLGNTVIGGHVYRGDALDALAGRYVFAVFTADPEAAAGALYTASPNPLDAEDLWAIRELRVGPEPGVGHYVRAVAEGEDGTLYVLTSDLLGPTGDTGQVWQVVAR